MIWDEITVLDLVENGKDDLGNILVEMVPSMRVKARKNAPKDEPISLDNRKVTEKEHLFYLPIIRSNLPELKFIDHHGQVYKVLSVEALTPRFTQLRAVTYEGRTYRR